LKFSHPYSGETLVFESTSPAAWMQQRTKLMTPVLETPELMLSPLSFSDAPSLFKGFNNLNVISNLSDAIPWPYCEHDMTEFIERTQRQMNLGMHAAWSIRRKEDETAIGVIGLRHDGEVTRRGFWLAEPHWGKGYMSQAVFAVQDFVFIELGLSALDLQNLVSNKASHRIKKKSGATWIGHVDVRHHGGETLTEVWRLERDTWLHHRASF